MRYTKLLEGPNKRRAEIVCDAVEKIVEGYKAAVLRPTELTIVKPTTSLAIPPRVGKSSIIRLASIEIGILNGMPGVAIAPFIDNVNQLCEEGKIAEMFDRYGISNLPFVTHRVHKLKTYNWWRREKHTPNFIVATAGLLSQPDNMKQFLDGIEDMHQRCGKLILVMIDECQYFKNGKAWGDLAIKILNAGGYIVGLTGTPVPGLPGFTDEYDDPIDAVAKLLNCRIENGRRRWFMRTLEGTKRKHISTKADFKIEWDVAFSIGALAKASAVEIDVEVFDQTNGKSLGPLSKLAEKELSGQLKGVVESSEFMVKAAEAAIDRLMFLRGKSRTSTARMLIVTGYDIHTDIKIGSKKNSNKHAREFKVIIEQAARARGIPLRTAIATGVTNEGETDKESADRINDFRDGNIDVLIVKGMGIVGLDVPECKVLIYGSVVREGPLGAQTLSRPLSEWDGISAFIIMPKDCKMLRLFDRTITGQGGRYSEADMHVVDEEEVDEPDPKPIWDIRNATVDGYRDHEGGKEAGNYENIIAYFRARYDLEGVTDLTIISMYKAGSLRLDPNAPPPGPQPAGPKPAPKTPSSNGEIINLDKQLKKQQGQFGSLAKSIVSKYCRFEGNEAIWRSKVSILQSKAKVIAGVKIKVTDIDDPATLERLLAALLLAEKQMNWRS